MGWRWGAIGNYWGTLWEQIPILHCNLWWTLTFPCLQVLVNWKGCESLFTIGMQKVKNVWDFEMNEPFVMECDYGETWAKNLQNLWTILDGGKL
jgi:hypothetical protein